MQMVCRKSRTFGVHYIDLRPVVKYKNIVKEYSSTGADVAKIKKGDNTEAWEDILQSVGEFAAIKGYDAIDMAGVMNKKHVIVLNCGKVVIEK